MYTASVRDSQAVLTLIYSMCKETEINTVPVVLGKSFTYRRTKSKKGCVTV